MRQAFSNLWARNAAVSRRHMRLAVALLGLGLGAAPGVVTGQAAVPEHSRAELQAEIGQMQGLVRACAASVSGCEPRAVPPNETIAGEGTAPKFTLRWDWLAEALDAIRTAPPAKNASEQARLDEARQDAMRASLEHLAALTQDLEGSGAGAAQTGAAEQASFQAARHAADAVLSGVDFDKVAPPSWWDRLVAKLWELIDRLFDSVGRLGAHRPWLGKLLELVFFLAAGVGLLLFVRRNFQRQRLAASLRVEQAARTAWDREATDWAAMADSAAAKGDWRDGVHCLYWAAIVRLESRRAWRHNPARTPREYVRLLKPGSVQRESLGGLTGLLERVWYGLRPAGAEEYSRARAWFERLSETGGALATAPAGASAESGGRPA